VEESKSEISHAYVTGYQVVTVVRSTTTSQIVLDQDHPRSRSWP